jgi:hypothetical protein
MCKPRKSDDIFDKAAAARLPDKKEMLGRLP